MRRKEQNDYSEVRLYLPLWLPAQGHHLCRLNIPKLLAAALGIQFEPLSEQSPFRL
jgi:hypothetical protein